MRRDATTTQILEELRRRLQGFPPLEALLPTYEAFLKMEEETDVPPLPLQYGPTDARSLLEQGTPLLQGGEVPLLLEPMSAVWRQVCETAARYLENPKKRLQEAKDWPDRQQETWLATMGRYFRDGEIAAEEQQEKDILTFLLVHTWRPFLLRWAADLTPLVEGGVWQRDRCPVCGGQPDFAYLSTEEGRRYLACSRCDTDWRYKRLGCPFCGNTDASTYGYYPGQDGTYRLYACKNCRRYLKTLDEREATAERLLAVERVATIGMDLSALQDGYQGS